MGTNTHTVPTDAERDAAIEQAQWDTKVQTFTRHMKHKIAMGDEAAAKVVADIAERGLYFALEWDAGPAIERTTEAALWAEVNRLYSTEDYASYGDPVKSLRPVVRQVERELLKNFVRKSSTSELANAVSGHEAQGKSRFHSDASGMLEFLTGETVTPAG